MISIDIEKKLKAYKESVAFDFNGTSAVLAFRF